MVTSDAGGLSSGIQSRGTLTVPSTTPQPPTAGSVTPASGSGQGSIFTFTFTDPNGFTDLILPEIIFNVFRDGRNACLVLYDRFSNRFFLVNDSSTGSSTVAAGSSEFAENGQCLLSGTGSSASGSGNTLTININVTFKQPFAGARNVFLFAQTVEGLNSGLPMVGTWTVPSYTNQPPLNVSVTPSSGSGNSQLFQLRFRDPNGYGDLVSPEVILNSTLDARNSCTVILDKLNGAALLLNDTATAATSVLLNSSQTAQNSQCILLGQGSLATAGGNDLVLQLNLQFKPGFAGTKNIYMYTTDQAGANSGLEAKGTFTAQ